MCPSMVAMQNKPFRDCCNTGGSSFESNSYAVDIRRLPENVEMEKSIFQSTLTEGAIGYKSLPVNKGYRVMATITLADGTALDLVRR